MMMMIMGRGRGRTRLEDISFIITSEFPSRFNVMSIEDRWEKRRDVNIFGLFSFFFSLDRKLIIRSDGITFKYFNYFVNVEK